MSQLLIVGGCLLVVLLLLWIERLVVNTVRSTIPLRLVVIGTRGKTSVTRLIAAGLREAGIRTLAKTTGSEARVIFPDGDEQPVRRFGLNTPLEQRRVLRLAARHDCDAAVIEAMSIRPESLRAELGRIISPHVVVVTNTHRDHVADMDDPATAFADAIPGGSIALLPKGFPRVEQERLQQRNVTIRLSNDESLAQQYLTRFSHAEWAPNLALALAACAQAGVSTEKALPGMIKARMDVGRLEAWILRSEKTSVSWLAINAFATNDPHSALAALELALERWTSSARTVVGLLNLRRDRGDRTYQWMEALDALRGRFDYLIVCGATPMSAERRLRSLYGECLAVVRSADPMRILQEAEKLSPEGGVLFGFGNIGGGGIRILDFWQGTGEAV